MHGGQPFLFLFFAAKGIDGIHHQRRLHAHKRAHAAVAALQLLHHQAIFDVAHAGAAVTFQAGAEETQLAEGLHQLTREASFAVALLDDGNQIVFDELAGAVTHQALVVAEQRIEGDEVHSVKSHGHTASLNWAYTMVLRH